VFFLPCLRRLLKLRCNLKLNEQKVLTFNVQLLKQPVLGVKWQKEKENTNKQISVKKAIIIAVLASVLVGSAVAAVLMTRQISNTMRMLGAANFMFVREDNLEVEVTSIAWGDFTPLESKNSLTILGTRICIYNTGNVGLILGWNVTGLDARWTLTCTSTGTPYPENFYNQFSIAPGNYNGYLVFTLSSVDPYHPAEDTGFTVSFYAIAS